MSNRPEDEWQDIATAPKDGEWVLVYWPTMPISIYPKVAFNCGDEYGWDTPDDYGQVFPTHWMPMPSPPDLSTPQKEKDDMASETEQPDAEDRITKERKMLARFGQIIMHVSDALADEDDRVYLGSTNDRDLLRAACQEWFEYRYLDGEQS